MTTFFSADVETSALDPWNGSLLTAGIATVRFEADPFHWDLLPHKCYVRIDRTDELRLQADIGTWENTEDPNSTYSWWIKQNDQAQDEAFRDPNLLRHGPVTAARMIAEFVREVEPDPKKRIFVANPVSFDKMWFEELFVTTGIDNPFHYQTLCLRSMKFGLRAGSDWVSTRDNHEPKIAHHAYWDALAQAHDLIAMLEEREGFDAEIRKGAAVG